MSECFATHAGRIFDYFYLPLVDQVNRFLPSRLGPQRLGALTRTSNFTPSFPHRTFPSRRLNDTIEALRACLFPLDWESTYIPRLPDRLCNYLEMTGCFLIGMVVEESEDMYTIPYMQALDLILTAKFNEAFLNACLYGWCCTYTFVLSCLCMSIFVLGLLLSLPIVCVVFPSLNVMCWSFLMGGGF